MADSSLAPAAALEPEASAQRPSSGGSATPSGQQAEPTTSRPTAASCTLHEAQEVPWQEGFYFGSGINALTGEVARASAVKEFSIHHSDVKTYDEMQYHLISTAEDYARVRSLSAGVSSTIHVAPVRLGAHSGLLSQVQVSRTSFCIYATCGRKYSRSNFRPTYALTQAARTQARDDPAGFRALYGDYFISDATRTSHFQALVVCSSSDSGKLREFHASAQAEMHGLFTAEGATKFTESAKRSDVHLRSYVCQIGTRQLPKKPRGQMLACTIQDFHKLLYAFDASEVGTWTTARLTHYSGIPAAYHLPRTLDVDRSVFASIRTLFADLDAAQTSLTGLSFTNTREGLISRLKALHDDALDHSQVLATDADTLRRLCAAVSAFRAEVAAVLARYALWVDCYADRNKDQRDLALRPEDRRGCYYLARSVGQRHWSWGHAQAGGDVLATAPPFRTGYTFSLRRPWRLLVPRGQWVRECPVPAGRIVVGYRVEARRDDGHNGGFRPQSDQFILAQGGSLKFKTEWWRDAEWEVTVFHVDAALYPFGSTPSGRKDIITGDLRAIMDELAED